MGNGCCQELKEGTGDKFEVMDVPRITEFIEGAWPDDD